MQIRLQFTCESFQQTETFQNVQIKFQMTNILISS